MAKTKTLQIKRVDYPGYSVSLDNPKIRTKYIFSIEKIIRGSSEYKDYIKFLKDFVDMTKCLFFKNVDGIVKGVKIEIHHEPFTLFDLVSIVLQKYIDEAIPLNDLLIADEVLELHYRNKVGLTPLAITVHKVITNSDKLSVPLFAVYGDYPSILREYGQYIENSDELEYIITKIRKKMERTKAIHMGSFDILKPTFVYFDIEGFPLIEDIKIEEPNENMSITA